MAELADRLMARVEKTPTCWLWTGPLTRDGYGGQIYVMGRLVLAHRVAYELFNGPIPKGLEVEHSCHTQDLSCNAGDDCIHRRCVNPAHLELLTHRENTLRGRSPQALNRHKTHCPAGHPYSPENTYRHRGRRECRVCIRRRAREYAARKRLAMRSGAA